MNILGTQLGFQPVRTHYGLYSQLEDLEVGKETGVRKAVT